MWKWMGLYLMRNYLFRWWDYFICIILFVTLSGHGKKSSSKLHRKITLKQCMAGNQSLNQLILPNIYSFFFFWNLNNKGQSTLNAGSYAALYCCSNEIIPLDMWTANIGDKQATLIFAIISFCLISKFSKHTNWRNNLNSNIYILQNIIVSAT